MPLLVSCCNISSDIPTPIRSQKAVTIIVEYNSWACGENTPRFLPVSLISQNISNESVEYGLTFYISSNFASLEEMEELHVQGNRFEISGYYYYTITDQEKLLHPKFDLVNWRALKPLYIWNNEGKKIQISDNKYMNWQDESNDRENNFYLARKYSFCK